MVRGASMIIEENDFELIFRQSVDLAHEDTETRRRRLGQLFEGKALGPGADIGDYLEVLLIAYLSAPTRIRTYRNHSRRAPNPSECLRVIFNVTPFKGLVSGGMPTGRFVYREDEAIFPLTFRDYLRKATLAQVEITSLQFGCLEVEYRIDSCRDDWKSSLFERKDFQHVMNNLSIRKVF